MYCYISMPHSMLLFPHLQPHCLINHFNHFSWILYFRLSPHSFFCVSILVHSFPDRHSSVNVLLRCNASLIIFVPDSPIWLSIHSYVLLSPPSLRTKCLFFFFASIQSSHSWVNALLVFNNSLIILVPGSPISLSVIYSWCGRIWSTYFIPSVP